MAEISGGRYRIALDESWKAEVAEQRGDKVWYEQIPCKGGAFIGVYSLEPVILQLYSPRPKNARVVWEAIKDIAGARADFHFDGEAVIYFSIEAVLIVAELAGARRKRRLSEEHKAKLAESSQAYRFKPKLDGSEPQESALF